MKRKIFSVLLTLVLVLSFGLVTAVPVSAVDHHAPQMEEISGLSVVTGDTWDVSTGVVELVFDFYDEDEDLRDLMIDWSLEPYTQARKAQTNFLATPDMGIDPGVLAAMAEVGLVPSYDVEEQKWTLSINTNAIMTAAIFAGGVFPWVENIGDPIFPPGRYDWYVEVRDLAGNKWGDMMAPPDYSHYVGYFHSIQSAIDDADVGDTITVAADMYNENIVVYKSLTITGAGAATTTIDGSGSGVVVAIIANDVTVSGFTITGSGSDPLAEGGVALLNVTGCTIKDNIVSNNAGFGIGLLGGSGNTIENNILDSNHLAGIGLQGSSYNTIESNYSTNTIEVLVPTTLGDNHMGYGIFLEYGPSGHSVGNTIDSNTFSGNEIDGVYFGQGGHGNFLTNNIITNNGMVGGVDAHGVYFWMGGGNTVTGNTITGNLASGIQLHQSAGNTINYNNISGNTDYGINTDTYVDATNNWWGHASGPSGNSGRVNNKGKVIGKGDAVSANVDWDPWLRMKVWTNPAGKDLPPRK